MQIDHKTSLQAEDSVRRPVIELQPWIEPAWIQLVVRHVKLKSHLISLSLSLWQRYQ